MTNRRFTADTTSIAEQVRQRLEGVEADLKLLRAEKHHLRKLLETYGVAVDGKDDDGEDEAPPASAPRDLIGASGA